MPPQPLRAELDPQRFHTSLINFYNKIRTGLRFNCQILLPVPSSSPRKFIFISLCNPSPAGIPKPSSPPTSPHQKGTFVLFKPPKILDLKKKGTASMKQWTLEMLLCIHAVNENIPEQLCMQLQYSQTSDKTLKLCFCFKLVWLVAKSNMSGEKKNTPAN